ncbi:MAG: rod shape-determining protein MreC [Bacteroidales bacterium]
MRNLIRFILNNHFFLLFILFEAVALFLVFQNNNYQRAFAFNMTRNISGKISSNIFSLRQYLYLTETNMALLEENSKLRNSLLSSYKLRISDPGNVEFDSAWTRQYNFMPARVIKNSVNKQYNFINIDKGFAHGIGPDMAVISGKGVVGIVTGVSEHFSTIIPVLNIDLRLSSKLKNTNYFGSLHWDGKDPGMAILNEIPHHVILNKGDTIVTSGFSAIFPEGIMVGIIDEFEIEGGNFYTVKVQLSTDFRNLNYVYVIEDLFKDELLELESTVAYD